jgi:transposase
MKQEIKQSIEDRNRQILELFARTGKSYSQVAMELGLSTAIVTKALTEVSLKGVIPKVNENNSWVEEPEMLEIKVKVSLVNKKVVHLIPSRMNFEV